VVFTSDAALERIVGVSSRVVGYAVAPADDRPSAQLLAGEFRLPSASLDTGLALRNGRLRSGRWLNASDFPDIVFSLTRTRDVASLPTPANPVLPSGTTLYSATLVGDLTIRGVTRPLAVGARLTFLPGSPATRRKAPGDLLIIRAEFQVNLREFGLNDPAMSVGMVAETVRVDLFLVLSTVAPDDGP